MSYGPPLTGANPNQRSWKVTFSKTLGESQHLFSYKNYTFDFPELTTLTEPYVERAIYTIEHIAVNQIQAAYNNKTVMLHCDAADATFNNGKCIQIDAAGATLADRNVSQVVGFIPAVQAVTSFQENLSFIGRWPLQSIAFQITDPFDTSDVVNASGTAGSIIVTLRVELIEPLENVTNEVVQTADYSGIKRARIAPLPPV
tara:strand:+ start:1678 stop:2280 length:603 start_codon:yes stop_codon:yes gene_type:complete